MVRGKADVIVVISLALVIVCLCPPAFAQEKALEPHLVISERSYDFKDVNEGDILEHSFQVSNTGNGILEIKNVKTT